MSNTQSIETTDQAKDDSSECCISGVCDYHNARNIAAAEHAEFVAHARQHVTRYAPVRKWMRDNPDWNEQQYRRWDRTVELHFDEVWDGQQARTAVVVVRKDTTLREVFHPATIAQAIDHLVTAEVLPVEFHSLAPVPMCERHDFYGNGCGEEAVPGTSRCGYHSSNKCGEPCSHGGGCTLESGHDSAHSASGLCHWYTKTAVA